MADNKRGGARPGSGRKATGSNTKHYTVNLTAEEAEMLERQAAQRDMKVNKYLRELIRLGGQYANAGLNVQSQDDDNMAASAKGRFVDEIISEKSYTEIENGREVHKTETHIRRWVPEDEQDEDEEVKPYVRNN